MNNALDYLHEMPVSPLGLWLVIGYVVLIGGALGSFLNVVAYRLPLGMSLSRPSSRCPKCEHPIRWYHNVPVAGWLALRGRCYDCGAPIAGRYPLVEFFVALASAVVCRTAIESTVAEGDIAYTIDLLALAVRLALEFTLFCVALLEFDGNRLPLRTSLGTLALILLAMWLDPGLRPTGHLAEPAVESLTELAYPVLSALLLGLLAWPLFFASPSDIVPDAITRATALLLVGLVLGGLAVQFAAVAAGGIVLAAIGAAAIWPPARRLGWAIALLVATLVWMLVAGSSMDSNEPIVWGELLIYFDEGWTSLALAGVLVAMETLAGRVILAVRRRSLRPLTSENERWSA